MPFYSYKATDSRGDIHKGILEADSEPEVVSFLSKSGHIPIRIRSAGSKSKHTLSLRKAVQISPTWGRIKTADVMLFTQDLANLLKAGLTIDRALQILVGVCENKTMQEIIQDLLQSVQKGASLSDALSHHPKVFSKFYTSMVRAGEVGGVLDDVLERLGEYLVSANELKEYIASSLIYPLFLVGVGGVSLIILLTFVIPKFSMIFETMGQTIPLATRVLLSSSEFVKTWWWLMAVIIALLLFGLLKFSQTGPGRLKIDTLKFRLPGIRNLVKKIEIARFSRTLGTLMHSGVPILQSLELVRDIIGNRVVADSLASVHERVKKGEKLSDTLVDLNIFPMLAIQMITVGEETGRMDEMLLKVAKNYEKSVRSTVKKLISLFEPAVILLMGIVIGFIVISMLMAIFSLNDLPF